MGGNRTRGLVLGAALTVFVVIVGQQLRSSTFAGSADDVESGIHRSGSGPELTSYAAILESSEHTQFVILNKATKCGHDRLCPPAWPTPPPSAAPPTDVVDLTFEHLTTTPLVIAPLETCVGNMWHAVVDFIYPLLATVMVQRVDGSHVTFPRPVLLVAAPRANMWGGENKGCPFYSTFPFGFTSATSPGGALLERFYERAVFYPRNSAWSRGPSVQATFQVAHVGLDRGCARFPPRDEWPFFLPDRPPAAPEHLSAAEMRCLRVHHEVIRALRGDDDAEPVVPRIQGARRVLVVLRANHKNGRHLENQVNLVHALAKSLLCVIQTSAIDGVSVNGDTARAGNTTCSIAAVTFEKLSHALQKRWVRWATVMIAARGAATVHAASLRSGSLFISLFPVHVGEHSGTIPNVSVAADNFPWWPFPFLRSDLRIAPVPCRALIASPGNFSYRFASARQEKNCIHRSPNYCDMVCSPLAVSQRILEHAKVSGHNDATGFFPPPRCGNTYCELVPSRGIR